ncbi:MAG: inosine monophosphate cyclohydrolase [SAR324 cluster bacterium]|nr:inosine monophosphate cyclohydrolase [SAR324 cluster bacterium]
MENNNSSSSLQSNIEQRIKNNAYPGRGIIQGKSDMGEWVQVYWIMGRSNNSRNRIFSSNDGTLQTQAADPSKVEDPSLIIYNAMREIDGCFIVTNGSQTDAIYEGLQQGKSFDESLLPQRHEPDAPNFTPRISGCLHLKEEHPRATLSIIKANPFDVDHSEHHFFHYTVIADGYGYAVTTYQEDGNPLPSFEGTPFLLPLHGNAQQIADTFWNALNGANKISLAVKTIDPLELQSAILIVNKYTSL